MLRKLFYTKTRNDRYEDVKLTLAAASVLWYGGERYTCKISTSTHTSMRC